MYLTALVLVAAMLIIWHFFAIGIAGRRLVGSGGSYDADALAYHKSLVKRVSWLMLGAVVVIEAIVQLQGVSHEYEALEYFHWTVDAIFVGAFVATALLFNGEKSRRWHSTFAYSTLVLFFLVSGSGLMMLYRYPL